MTKPLHGWVGGVQVEVAGGEEGEEKLATVSELLLQKKFMVHPPPLEQVHGP